MTHVENLMHMMRLSKEIANLQERMQSHMTIKREELFLAMQEGDPAKIENARQAAVDTFSSFLDQLIKAHADARSLEPK